jgi:polysaccharide biosynthesis transport protein
MEMPALNYPEKGQIHLWKGEDYRFTDVSRDELKGDNEPNLILKYWRLVQRRRGLLVLSTLLALIVSCLITLRLPRTYRARTSVEVQGWNDEFLNRKAVDPTNPLPDFSGDAYIQTQMKVMQSDLLLQRTIERIERLPLPTKNTKEASGLAKWFSRSPAHKADRHTLLAQAAASIQVRMAGDTHIVEVFCDSADPQLAAQFANVLVQEFIEHNRESRWTSAQETGEWLTRQMKDIKGKLESSEHALQDYASTAGLEFTDEKNSVAQARLRQLQEELSKSQAERVEKQSLFDLIAREPNSAFALSGDPTAKELESKLADLNRQRAELGTTMTPENVKIRRVDAQLSDVRSSLEAERARAVAKINNDFDVAFTTTC